MDIAKNTAGTMSIVQANSLALMTKSEMNVTVSNNVASVLQMLFLEILAMELTSTLKSGMFANK